MKKRLFALFLAVVMALSLGMAGAEGPDAAVEAEEIIGTSAPAESEAAPVEDETAPVEDETAPAENETAPAENETAPAENETAPAENEAAPAENEAEPVENEAEPVENEAEPVENEAAPAENEAEPAGDETAPVEDEAEPAPLADEDPVQCKVTLVDAAAEAVMPAGNGINEWLETGVFEMGKEYDIYVLDPYELWFEGVWTSEDEYIPDPTGAERFVHVYHVSDFDETVGIGCDGLSNCRVTVNDPDGGLLPVSDGINGWRSDDLIGYDSMTEVYLRSGYALEVSGDNEIWYDDYRLSAEGELYHVVALVVRERTATLDIVEKDPSEVPNVLDVTYNDPDGAIVEKPAKAITDQSFVLMVKKGYVVDVKVETQYDTYINRAWNDEEGDTYNTVGVYVEPDTLSLTVTAEKARMVTLIIDDPNGVLTLTDSNGNAVTSGSQFPDDSELSYTLKDGWELAYDDGYTYYDEEPGHGILRLRDTEHKGTVTITPQKTIYLHINDPDGHIIDSYWADGDDITGMGGRGFIDFLLDGEYSLAVTGGVIEDVYFNYDPDTDKLTRECYIRVKGGEDVTVTPVADPDRVPLMTTFTYVDPDGAILNKPARTLDGTVSVTVRDGYSLQVAGGEASRMGRNAAGGYYYYSVGADYPGTNVTVTAVKSDGMITLQINDPDGALKLTDGAGSTVASGAVVALGTKLSCSLQPGYWVNTTAGRDFDENGDLIALTVLDNNVDGIEKIKVEKCFHVILNDPEKVIKDPEEYKDRLLYGAGGQVEFSLPADWTLEATNGEVSLTYIEGDPVTGEVRRIVCVVCTGTGDVTVTPVKSGDTVPTPIKIEYVDPYNAITNNLSNYYVLPGDGFDVLVKTGYTLQVLTGGEVSVNDLDRGFGEHSVGVYVNWDATAVKVTTVPLKAGAKLAVNGQADALTTKSPDVTDYNEYLLGGDVMTTGSGYVLVKNGYMLRAVSGCHVGGGYCIYGKVNGDVFRVYRVEATDDVATVEVVPSEPAKWVNVTIVNNSDGSVLVESATGFSTSLSRKTMTILKDGLLIFVRTDYGCSIKVTGGTYFGDGVAYSDRTMSFYVTPTGDDVTIEVNVGGECAHVWDGGTVIVEPTCMDGVRVYVCTLCGMEKDEYIPATKAHTWGDVTVTVKPTYVTEGRGVHTCSVCGKQEEVSVPVLTPGTGAEVPAGTVQDLQAAQTVLSSAAQSVVDALASGTVPPGGSQALVDAILAELAKVSAAGGEATISTKLVVTGETVTVPGAAAQYDIEIQVFVNDTEVGNLTSVPSAIGLTLPLPAVTGRIIYVVRVHDGVREKLPTTVANGMVGFASDKFSTYAIVSSNDIADATVDAIADQTYTGSEIRPAVKVTIQGPNGTEVLTEGKDYTLSYKNNTAVGTATVVITGIGDFAGSVKEVTFQIVGVASTATPTSPTAEPTPPAVTPTSTAGATSPQTGDETDAALWAGVLALSLGALALVLTKQKKARR